MKAITNNDGTNAKPILPYWKPVYETNTGTELINEQNQESEIEAMQEYESLVANFESEYPERPLTSPQQPNVQIEIEGEVVWQFKAKDGDHPNKEHIGKGWVTDGNPKQIYEEQELSYIDFNDYKSSLEWGYDTRQAYKPIEQPKEQPQSASIETVEQAAEAFCRDNLLHGKTAEYVRMAFVYWANWQKHQSIELMIGKILGLLNEAAQRGHDFGCATENTICYDTTEELIATEFKPQLIKLLKDGK